MGTLRDRCQKTIRLKKVHNNKTYFSDFLRASQTFELLIFCIVTPDGEGELESPIAGPGPPLKDGPPIGGPPRPMGGPPIPSGGPLPNPGMPPPPDGGGVLVDDGTAGLPLGVGAGGVASDMMNW